MSHEMKILVSTPSIRSSSGRTRLLHTGQLQPWAEDFLETGNQTCANWTFGWRDLRFHKWLHTSYVNALGFQAIVESSLGFPLGFDNNNDLQPVPLE
jgi:hypothetical protein